MRKFSTPIYVLFFVLAGARLGLTQMPGWLWVLVAIYVLGRTAGKVSGAYAGARYSGSEPQVRRYLGLGLFAQGGVAIGLSIMASHHLTGVALTPEMSLGDTIISGVAATTLIVQLAGPPMVKLALKLSGEAGRDVTRQDVIDSWTVADVMDKDVVPIKENQPLVQVVQAFVEHDRLVYPVVDAGGAIVGEVSFDSLKDVITNRESWRWLLASDVMMGVRDKVFPSTPLGEAVRQMRELNIEQMPVVRKDDGDVPIGMLDLRTVMSQVEKELIRRRKGATETPPAKPAIREDVKMSPYIKLGDMKVDDVRHFLVTEPTVVRPEQSVDELLAKMVEALMTRHVYVVDTDNRLVGAVRMNTIVRYLFPFSAAVSDSSEVMVTQLVDFEGRRVGDIMDDRPSFVKPSTTLSEMAQILIEEKINELPVVDDDMHIVGQVNVYEVIMAYLKQKSGK